MTPRANNKPYLFTSPGSVITYRSDTFTSVVVEAVYSPAQGVTGKALKTFEPVRTETASSNSTCSNQEKDCSTTSAASSVSVSPITWEIHATDLLPD